MDEEKIAQGTYDFRVMREDGFRYVDKTALLYPLVTRGRDSFADALDAGVSLPR